MKEKKIPEQELMQRVAEKLQPILKAIQEELDNLQIADDIVTELSEELAKLYCKSRKDIPAWAKLTAVQRKMCRVQGEKQLQLMVEYFQQKIASVGV